MFLPPSQISFMLVSFLINKEVQQNSSSQHSSLSQYPSTPLIITLFHKIFLQILQFSPSPVTLNFLLNIPFFDNITRDDAFIGRKGVSGTKIIYSTAGRCAYAITVAAHTPVMPSYIVAYNKYSTSK